MEQILSEVTIKSSGQGFTDITSIVNEWIKQNNINKGILIIFCKHTSCSLTINENADPRVLKDLSNYIKAIAPEDRFISINGEGKRQEYFHCDEGKDDMPAHIKTMLSSTNLSLSIDKCKLMLGTWQAIYLWEHRYLQNSRKLNFHAIGEVI